MEMNSEKILCVLCGLLTVLFSSQFYRGQCTGNKTEDASELIKRFPDSRFIPWAKIYLANYYRYGYSRRIVKSGGWLGFSNPSRTAETMIKAL